MTRGEHPAADAVNTENRLGNMEYAHMLAIGDLFGSLTDAQKAKVRAAFRLGTPIVWPMEAGIGVPTKRTVSWRQYRIPRTASAVETCVRLAGRQLFRGTLTVIAQLYANPPAWTRFEGEMPEFLDPGDPMDNE